MKWMVVSITMCQRKHLKTSCTVTGKLDIQNLILPSGCFILKIDLLFSCFVQNFWDTFYSEKLSKKMYIDLLVH